MGEVPMFLVHQEYGECKTNIIPTTSEAESWATKLRLTSGRPLDEANPVLDTEIEVKGGRARVAAITRPLSPDGTAFALRRFRSKPWTFPLFINAKMIDPFSAGLLWFLIDGARTMLIAGTRSSGKCVEGNTLIQLSDGRILPVKELVGDHKMKIADGDIYYPKENYKVQCLNKFNLTLSDVTDVWKREAPKSLTKIMTRSGKEIITTPEHPYFTYNNGIKNIRADELKKGFLIASPRKVETSSSEILFDIKNKPYFLKEETDHFLLKGKTNSLTVKFPKKLDKEMSELIGLIIGDGHIDKTKLEFVNNCEELRERYIYLIRRFGVPYRVFKSRNTQIVQISSRILSKALSDIFGINLGKKADKITIPEAILKSGNEILAAFLRGYFDTDGYVSKKYREIEIASASKPMSDQLKLALLRFGIVSFCGIKKVDGRHYFRTTIRGEFVNEFGNNIGFSHPSKKSRVKSILDRKSTFNTNVDTVPQGNDIIKKLRNSLRINPKEFRLSGKDYWAYEKNQYRVSRRWFKKIVKFYRVELISRFALPSHPARLFSGR